MSNRGMLKPSRSSKELPVSWISKYFSCSKSLRIKQTKQQRVIKSLKSILSFVAPLISCANWPKKKLKRIRKPKIPWRNITISHVFNLLIFHQRGRVVEEGKGEVN